MRSHVSSSAARGDTGHLQTLERRLLMAIVNVDTAAELIAAVNNGAVGDQINVAAGTYVIDEPLKPKGSMIIDGAGAGQTIIRGATSWNPGTAGLPDNGTSISSTNRNAYLFSFPDNTKDVTITDMTLNGPQLHGALLGSNCDNLELGNLKIDDFLWSGVRTFLMDGASIHDNEFVNTGGRWQSGSPGTTGGVTGGGIYVTYMKTSEIWNNNFYRTNSGQERNFYGIKGREARNSRIHHNTINVGFSIEFPFEHDYNVEIDHNYLRGTVSIPKSGGGTVPSGGYTFHIHHNYMKQSYALEFPRHGIEINNNLMDFATTDDGGNLITNFAGSGDTASTQPIKVHNNLIKNPGRGLYNSNGAIANNFQFYNNHVIGNTTVNNRTDGMFGFPGTTDFSTIQIKDNIFEFNGTARPLFKNTASRQSVVSNNTLTNVSDSGTYSNPNTGATRGPLAALNFTLGKNDEYTVNGWNLSQTGTAPAAPSGLIASAASSSAINLSWSDNSSNETGFEVQYKASSSSTWLALVTTGADDESHQATGLLASTSYDFRVRATNASGSSAWSNLASATTQAAPSQGTNLATSGTISAFSAEQVGNEAAKAIDGIEGDDNNRWSASGYPQWIEIDLGSDKSLTGTSLDTYADRAYKFKVEARTASGTYSTIVDRTGNTSAGPINDTLGSAVTARFVKLTVTGASGYTGTWVSVREFKVFGSSASQQPSSITASEDAFVRGGSFASTNYGAELNLQAKDDSNSSYDRESYLKFNLGSISSAVSDAKLKLKVTNGGSDAATTTFDVLLVPTDTWSQGSLTWNSKPATSTLLGSFTGAPIGSTIEVDVTGGVNSQLADGTLSLAIVSTQTGSQRWIDFASSEVTTAADRPTLVITP
jgi:hypothetical protein